MAAEWLRAAGFGQEQMRERFGVFFVVTETAVRVTIACVDAGTLRPRRIPTPILEALFP